ncbi:MAG: ComF family protein [Ruminococcaceae bacterium]|nr:ComF family protein [Oscillospiraceae bacterium]
MTLIDFIFPPKCASCGELLESAPRRIREKGGDALCPECRAEWEKEKLKKCSYCGQAMMDCLCAPWLMRKNGHNTLIKLVSYHSREHGVVQDLIFSLKRRAYGKAEIFLSNQLSLSISKYIKEYPEQIFCITNVPRRKKGIMKNGYDHAEVLARLTSELCGVPYLPLIRRKRDRSEQKNLTEDERLQNVSGVFDTYFIPERFKKMSVILVDDVVTTGASMLECISVLQNEGFKNVVPASVAMTVRKRKTGISSKS